MVCGSHAPFSDLSEVCLWFAVAIDSSFSNESGLHGFACVAFHIELVCVWFAGAIDSCFSNESGLRGFACLAFHIEVVCGGLRGFAGVCSF